MKGKQQDIQSIIKSKETSFKALLLYGPNSFVIENLYKELSKSLIDEEKEIFGSREFEAKEITGDAGEFHNETQSLALGSEKKYLKINMTGSEAGGAILEFLKTEQNDVTLIIKAGTLSPRSSLRRAVESSDSSIIVPFYEDDARGLITFMQDKARENKFSITKESCNEIISLSGFDRGRINNSIESLMLYLESSVSREIGIEEVRLVLFDTNQSQINEICKNVCLGRTEESQKILSRLILQGVTAPQLVSAFLVHFQKIHMTGLKILSGVSINDAIKEIKPPIFYKEIKSYQNQVENWNIKKTERALDILVEADLKTKEFSELGSSIIGDIVLRLSNVARK